MTELSSWILANQSSAIILLDEQQRVLYLNTAAEVLFSISQRKALHQNWSLLFRCPKVPMAEVLQSALQKQYPVLQHEMEVKLLDEQNMVVDCIINPLLNEQQEPVLLLEMRRVDQQLRRNREEQLINQNSATRELLRGLAHEIKNPLGGLRGAAQLLQMELNDAELLEYTQVIIAEADRLTALVDQMLGSRQQLVKKKLNIHHVLERVCAIILSDPEYQNQIERDYDPSIPELCGDKDQLIQAILNIVKNAAQATQGRGRIILKTRILRQFVLLNRRYRLVVRIQVIDEGPGIPPELQPQIFYPLVTGSDKGTGLGLSIAQSIVNRHQGIIEFDSRVGQTVFTIYLPLIDHE